MKRSPLNRSVKRWRTKPNLLPTATRQLVLERAGWGCEAGVGAICRHKGEHVHHMRLRSQGGSHDPENLMAVCWPCHEWIHQNPQAAAGLGWIRRTEAS